MAYNATRSAVTGYSPYYLLFGRRPRIPVDYQFPTILNPPHPTRMEESVAAIQKRLKEAFAVARQLTSEEAAKQSRYYNRNAGAVALQPGDVVMVRTDASKGKRKVKDRWEEGGFVVESQLEDWPVYKVRCPPTINVDSTESAELQPSLVTCQSGDTTSRIWLNGEFRTKPWFPLTEAFQGPTDSVDGEDSDLEPDLSGSEDEGT